MEQEQIVLAKADGSTVAFRPIGTNTLCRIEDEMGLHFGQLLAELGVDGTTRWKLSTTRRFFQYCAVGEVSLEEIGDLIDHQGFDRIAEVLSMLIAPAYVREAVHA